MKTTFLALLAILSISFVALAASAAGTWSAEVPGRNGTNTMKFTFEVSGSELTGTIDNGRGAAMISDGKVDGDTITFSQKIAGRDGNEFTIKYTGKVSDDHIDFTRDTGRGNPAMFTAKKQ